MSKKSSRQIPDFSRQSSRPKSATAPSAASVPKGKTVSATPPRPKPQATAGNTAVAAPDAGAQSVPQNGQAPSNLGSLIAQTNTTPAPQTDTPVHIAVTTGAPTDLNALAVRIARHSDDGNNQFSIRLDPPSLGRIDIKLHVDSQGQAQAQLTADKPQTLDLLQRARRARAALDGDGELGALARIAARIESAGEESRAAALDLLRALEKLLGP